MRTSFRIAALVAAVMGAGGVAAPTAHAIQASGSIILSPSKQLQLAPGEEFEVTVSAVNTSSQTPLPPGPARPSLLLEQPEPICVIAEVPEGPPARFTWRRVERRILKAQGPQRVAPEWWDEIAAKKSGTRDYYRIEDEDDRAIEVQQLLRQDVDVHCAGEHGARRPCRQHPDAGQRTVHMRPEHPGLSVPIGQRQPRDPTPMGGATRQGRSEDGLA